MNVQQATYSFGAFEFDPAQHELLRGEIRIVLSISLNRLLLLFMTRPGGVVTRQQIADALWEEHATIDVTAGINTAIKRLRTHLDDGSSESSLIETLVGVGYRFTAPVSIVPMRSDHTETAVMEEPAENANSVLPLEEADESSVSAIEPSPAPIPAAYPLEKVNRSRPWWHWAAAAAIVILAVTATAAGWDYLSSRRLATPAATMNAPFMRQPHPLTYDEPEDQLTAQALSPSGKYIVYAERSGLTLRTLGPNPFESDPEKRLDIPKDLHVETLAWFPDESALLASGTIQANAAGTSSAPKNQTWLVTLSGAQSHVLLDDAAMGCVSPDGRWVSYLRAGKTEVWIANIAGNDARKLTAAKSGDHFSALLWSPRGDRIVVDWRRIGLEKFPILDTDSNPASPDPKNPVDSVYESYDVKTGALRSSYPGLSFDSALLLSNGTLLYSTNTADKNGLAVVRTDPATGAVLDQKLIPTPQLWDAWAYSMTQLSGTRDGDVLSAIVEKPANNVYTADLVTRRGSDHPELDRIARLSFHTGTAYPSAWSPDGRGVVFDDGTAGPVSVSMQALDGSPLQHFAKSGLSTLNYTRAQFSPNGKWLLFQEYDRSQAISINRVPAHGGTPEALHTTGKIEEFHCSGSPAGRCVMREVEGKSALVYYALDPVTGMGGELARVPWQPNVLGDWNISPDGRTVAMANHDPQNPSIQLVPLPSEPGKQPSSATIRAIPLQDFGTAFSAHWSSDGKALFVEAYKAPSYELVWLTLDGRASLLQQSRDLIWAVPSPDGKKIAFPALTPLNRNIWAGSVNLNSVSGK